MFIGTKSTRLFKMDCMSGPSSPGMGLGGTLFIEGTCINAKRLGQLLKMYTRVPPHAHVLEFEWIKQKAIWRVRATIASLAMLPSEEGLRVRIKLELDGGIGIR